MRKFYNFETMIRSLKDDLRAYLKSEGIYFEISGGAGFWHFEVECNEAEVRKVNDWLNANTIIAQ